MNQTYSSIPDEHLRAIGLITVNFGYLEMWVEAGVWKLLGYERKQDIGKIITSELSFKNKVTLLKSLHNHLCEYEEAKIELKEIIRHTDKVETERNKIIHSVYGVGENVENIMRFKITAKRSKGLKYKTEYLSEKNLIDSADDFMFLAQKLLTFITNKKFPNPLQESEN